MGLCRRRGGREVFKVEGKLGVDRQAGGSVVRNIKFAVVANQPAHGPWNARFCGRLRARRRGEGLRQSRRSVYHGFNEAHLTDLPATKIVEIERDASSGEGKESGAVLARLEDERFRGEAVRKGDLEFADFDGRSGERSFQRPFGKSRKVPRGEINPRHQNEGRNKEQSQQRAQPPAQTPWRGPMAGRVGRQGCSGRRWR